MVWQGIGEGDSGRPADVSTSEFPRAASRTRRARSPGHRALHKSRFEVFSHSFRSGPRLG